MITPTTERLDALTSLRWFAALAVFGRHLVGSTDLAAKTSAVRLLQQGAVGVSFFFLLSGFVLAWSHQPTDRPLDFYRRRLARIYPAYLFACILAVVLSLLFTSTDPEWGDLRTIGLVQAWSNLSKVNYAITSVNWSLSVEVFFYALFPFVIAPLTRIGTVARRASMAALVTFVIALPLVLAPAFEGTVPFYWIYIAPPTRLAEFLLGIFLVAEVRAGSFARIGVLPASGLALAAYFAAGSADVWAQQSLMWVACTVVPFAVLIGAVAAAELRGGARALRARWLVRLGTWSYAFYLLHTIVISRVLAVSTNGIVVLALALPLAILSAALLHGLVERPAERRLRGTGAVAVAAP